MKELERFWSALILVASVGALLYLGGMESMIQRAIENGTATLFFDWLEPTEAGVVIPFIFGLLTVNIFVELYRVVRR